MIELIGFWSGVTLFTVVSLAFPAFALVLLADTWVERVTGGEVCEMINHKLEPFLLRIKYLGGDAYYRPEMTYGYILQLISAAACFLLVCVFLKEGKTPVHVCIEFGEAAAPYLAWFTIGFVSLFMLDSFAKKMYKLGKKINKALEDETQD